MDRDVAERIATALEQIALELAATDNEPYREAVALVAPPAPITYPAPTPNREQWAGNAAAFAARPTWACPIHNDAKVIPAGFSRRTNKPYAAFTVCAVDGCRERPPVAGTQLP